jgi:hypothetical protein
MADLRWTLLAAGLLCGCSQLGGGTEVPSSNIQVYIIGYNQDTGGAGPVAARQTRIWALDSQSEDSVSLTSRGLLTDSAGVLQLPPDSGTFLLESWIRRAPPESLSLRAKYPAKSFFDTSCRQLLGRGGSLHRLTSCRDTLSNPSRAAGGEPPELVAVVRVSGGPAHPFRMLLGADTTTLHPVEVRLWSWGNDSLAFRGVLRVGELPTLTEKAKFVIQGWTRTGMAPDRIPVKRSSGLTIPAWDSCAINLAAFGSSVTTLHSCRLQSPMPDDSADFWSAVDFVP